MAGAREVTAKLRALCDTVPRINIDARTGDLTDSMTGDVELRDDEFTYLSAEEKKHDVL